MDPTAAVAEAQVGYEAGVKVALSEQMIKFGSPDGMPFLLVQPGMTVKTIEETCEAPKSRRGNIIVTSVKSFIELVQREYAEHKSVIFANLPNNAPGDITAVIDFHKHDGAPSWSEYRIILQLSYTAEWMEWLKVLNKCTLQLELAEFLEERYIDVHEANGITGATILEVALSLEAKKGVSFKNAVRLDNGDVSLQFEETTMARAGQKGELEIPKEFTLFIPVYEGFAACPIRVLLRYRIKDGVLGFICKPVNIERTLIAIREAIVQEIADETELSVYMGNANSIPTRKLT